MTPAASPAVGPLQAWMIAALRRASSALEWGGLSPPLDFSKERGRRRERRPPAGRRGRWVAFSSDGDAVNKHLPPERQIRRIASNDDADNFSVRRTEKATKAFEQVSLTTLAFYFRLATFPRCCSSRTSGAYSVSSCGCFEAAAL